MEKLRLIVTLFIGYTFAEPLSTISTGTGLLDSPTKSTPISINGTTECQEIPIPAAQSSANRSFRIDYDNNVFLKDDKPFQYAAGALDYFRVPKAYWRDRLRKLRAAGLNVVTTHVEWSYHEPSPRHYDFNEDKDLEYFIELAAEEDLLVILRPGPYIVAERDFGGFPAWLLSLYPQIKLRSNDEDYKTEVKIWFNLLLGKIQKYLYGKGGPIIMVQVEHEYGSYACDSKYKIWLRDLMLKYIKNDAVLFTADMNDRNALKCGNITGVYATVTFATNTDVTNAAENMRQYQKRGPLVNSEFFTGWFSSWGKPKETRDTESILQTMQQMLALNVSFNFYLLFGGTNFGFTNGADFDGDKYMPQSTSYDFDAPLDEAGDPTDKYFEIRKLLSQHFKLPDIPAPKPSLKGNYGKVTLKPILSLFDLPQIPDKKERYSKEPLTFEQMEVYYGLYETQLPEQLESPALLHIDDLKDRAIVFIDEVRQGILSRTRHIRNITVVPKPDGKLQLLVENQGRISQGPTLKKDIKGIVGTPTINGKSLTYWKMVGLPFSDVSWVEKLVSCNCSGRISPPAYYYGELILPPSSLPLRTYVDLTCWGKGVIFINGHNLGRYWPGVGPQVTLFVPASYLNPAPLPNKIVVFETEYAPRNFQIKFTDTPYLNKTPTVLL